MRKVDSYDVRLLKLLQQDTTLSIADMAEEVGLSQNACWRRLKTLEEEGYILKKVALLNYKKLGCGVTVYVTVRTNQHTEDWLEKFAKGIHLIPEVVEFHRMSGDVDYFLKIRVRDIDDYDRIYKKIIKCAPLVDVSSFFAMERIKETTEIPLSLP
ncbi:Lrp/AsnC family transcriptional regulator [Kordiimonas pumila]|uniref:Lrp/AsnC family transcriptional regulator n=1 Tax=Kordiimonas pumila TaxID=2161677 RepID=A0ABV7DA52_9PROT|nr:Lrp/AsnC family transcriptional regulator [Kordiimonas pumila]